MAREVEQRETLGGRQVAPLVRTWLDRERDAVLRDLRRLVELESPTGNGSRLAALAEWLAGWFAPLGDVRTIATRAGSPPHVLIETGAGAEGGLLVLCHYDTVWPEGTLSQWGFEVSGAEASGPGILDMKASIVLVHYAHQALRALGVSPTAGIQILITADEEQGNPTSRELIEGLAKHAGAALVMEPPLADGRLKTSRKGYARLRLEITGRSAHAGIAPEEGINAAIEAAHTALMADALNDSRAQTSVTVGALHSGRQSNVVPSSASLTLDVRAASDAELQRVVDALRTRTPQIDGAQVQLHVDELRGPMPRLATTDPLLASARGVGDALGMSIDEGHTGGVSEGNLTQAVGTPTLDGLGVVGVGAHTPDERIQVRSLLERAALHAGMLVDLGSRRA
jgi:glutamate carboxypeptidase